MNTALRIEPTPMRLVIGVLFVVGAAGLFGCKDEAGSSAPRPIPEVQVVEATSQTIPDEPELIGQAEASSIVEIRPQVTGIIKQRFFSEGRDVKHGDRLYEIDPVPFKAAFASAKGRVAQAEARVVQAKQDLARVKPLLVEDAVSQKDVDDAVAEDLAARAALEAARGDLVKAKFDLDNTVIVAPVDGLIERTRYYQGRLVTAQTDLLTVIHQVDPMYVIVSAPESFLLKRRRDTLSKRIQHPGIYKLTGTIIFVVPFAVILAVPFGVFGALSAVWLSGMTNDIYFQIGLVTLIGLSAKNAILIVEFANQRYQHGLSLRDAASEAARLRFRPILMTSLAFILGVVPLVVAGGAGAASRHSIGTGVFGGMIAATILSVLFVPLFFTLIRMLGKPATGPVQRAGIREDRTGLTSSSAQEGR